MVSAPVLLRPPVRGLTVSRGLYGLSVVMSSLTSFVAKRRDGVIGRNDLIGIVLFLACAAGFPTALRFLKFCYVRLNLCAARSLETDCFRGCPNTQASSRPL